MRQSDAGDGEDGQEKKKKEGEKGRERERGRKGERKREKKRRKEKKKKGWCVPEVTLSIYIAPSSQKETQCFHGAGTQSCLSKQRGQSSTEI